MVDFEVGYGIRREISTSKIRNRIAIMKNCVENGTRWFLISENPHSKGDHFSFVLFFTIETSFARPRTAAVRVAAIVIVKVVFIASFYFLIGNQTLPF